MKELYENLCDDFREKFLSLVKHSCYLSSSVTHIVQADYINIFEKSNNVKLKSGYYSSSVKYYVNNAYKYEFDFLIESDTLILSIFDLVTDNELARYYFTFDNCVVADFFNTEENTSEPEPEQAPEDETIDAEEMNLKIQPLTSLELAFFEKAYEIYFDLEDETIDHEVDCYVSDIFHEIMRKSKSLDLFWHWLEERKKQASLTMN